MKKLVSRLALALAPIIAVGAIGASSAMAYDAAHTEGATLNSARTVVLHGRVNTNETTNWGFQYGKTTEYGNEGHEIEVKQISAEEGKAAEEEGVKVTAIVTGLTPGQTYNYRLVSLGLEGGGFSVGENKQVTMKGTYLTGEASESEANRPKFAATKYGVFNYRFGSTPFTVMETRYGDNVKCTGSEGSNLLAGTPFTAFPATVPSASCVNKANTASVRPNGCYYTYELANVGPPYAGPVKITCGTGKTIEVEVGPCLIKIGAQTVGEAASYSEQSVNGTASSVLLATHATGVKAETIGSFCTLMGLKKEEEVKFSGNVTMFNPELGY